MPSSQRHWSAKLATQASSLIALAALTACSTAPSSQVESSTGDRAEGERLQVVTTFLPMTQFTRAVAGSCAEVSQLLPSGVGPHDYNAKPTDAQRLSQADVLVQNGLELEQFLEPMIANAGNESLLVIDSSEGLPLLAMANLHSDEHGDEHHDDHGDEHAGEHHDEHEHHDHGDEHEHHDHDDEHAGEHHDDHGDEHHDEHAGEHHDEHGGKTTSGHAGHNHGEFDPHVWLDPLLAAQQIDNIRDGLIAAKPDCEAEFTANAAAFSAKLDAFNQETEQTLAPFSGKSFVTYHDFAAYFGDRYNIKPEFLVNVPEQNPSPTDVQRVMDAVQDSGLKTLLVESEASAKPFETLAQDLGVSVSTFRPNAIGDGDDPDAYFTLMKENVANLAAAFSAQ